MAQSCRRHVNPTPFYEQTRREEAGMHTLRRSPARSSALVSRSDQSPDSTCGPRFLPLCDYAGVQFLFSTAKKSIHVNTGCHPAVITYARGFMRLASAMIIIKLDDRWWPARRIVLRYSTGELIRRFSDAQRLREFLSSRPRTTYRLEGFPCDTPLPPDYLPQQDDILVGEIWFDSDQGKIVTN
jgi:hypothetical protein